MVNFSFLLGCWWALVVWMLKVHGHYFKKKKLLNWLAFLMTMQLLFNQTFAVSGIFFNVEHMVDRLWPQYLLTVLFILPFSFLNSQLSSPSRIMSKAALIILFPVITFLCDLLALRINLMLCLLVNTPNSKSLPLFSRNIQQLEIAECFVFLPPSGGCFCPCASSCKSWFEFTLSHKFQSRSSEAQPLTESFMNFRTVVLFLQWVSVLVEGFTTFSWCSM